MKKKALSCCLVVLAIAVVAFICTSKASPIYTAAVKLYSTYRGQQITFPVNLFTSEFIASRIVAEYDGKNVRQLATKYGYSEKWIRKMIKEHNKKEK